MKTFSKKELLRFLIGGGTAVLIDFTSYHILFKFIEMDYAKAISYILGAIVGFIINKLWTFEKKQFRPTEILKYCILYACSAKINVVIYANVLKWLQCHIIAFLAATGTSTIINYLGQKFFVFSSKSPKGEKCKTE